MLDLILISFIGGLGGFGLTYTAAKLIENKNVTELKFVKEQELVNTLKSEDINKKNANCVVCNKKIRKDNIGMVISKNNQNYFVCKDNDCLIVGDIAVERNL